MSKYGFIYLWYDRKHKRFYLGSHWGSEDDGYICSSRWMRKAYRRRPKDFKRRIIKRIYSNRIALYETEQHWLNMIQCPELGKKYYNLKKIAGFHWFALSDPDYKKSVGQKISVALKGRKYKSRTEETKQRVSEARKGKPRGNWTGRKHTEESRRKMSEVQKGRKHTEETKRKMSESKKGKSTWTGRKHTEESRRKMSESKKSRAIIQKNLNNQ